MTMTDPIADMFTRIRNALAVEAETVDMPSSRLKERVADVLKQEGFVQDWRVGSDPAGKKTLRVYLKYGPLGQKIISYIQRESRPGKRVYMKATDMQPVLNGLGIRLVSTSKGVMSDRQCRKTNVGGEVFGKVY